MPDITMDTMVLQERFLDMRHPDGRLLHFAKSRPEIEALVATFGWPNMVGIFISGSEENVPDTVMHRSQFPPQTGSLEQRAEKLQIAIDTILINRYENLLGADGEPIGKLRVRTKFWVYKNDPNLFVPVFEPRSVVISRGETPGDYRLSGILSFTEPALDANWWKEYD